MIAILCILCGIHAQACVLGCSKSSDESKKGSAENSKESPKTPSSGQTPTPTEDTSKTTGGDLGYGDDARLFASAGDAMRVLLREGDPRVIGFGEYHQQKDSPPVRSALARFTEDFPELFSPDNRLLIESWVPDPACGKKGKAVTKAVKKAIDRPPETESELETLWKTAEKAGMPRSLLGFTCEEYATLAAPPGSKSPDGELNADVALELIARKLGEGSEVALEGIKDGKGRVLVYGGATHNDRFPYPGLEAWAYAPAIAEKVEDRYLEVDLYVPELIAGDPVLEKEPWYPLLQEAREDKVILIRRDPRSYIIIMRKGRK